MTIAAHIILIGGRKGERGGLYRKENETQIEKE